jgi:hypothetical protein
MTKPKLKKIEYGKIAINRNASILSFM